MADETHGEQTHQAAREAKLRKKKQKIKQHGKGIGKLYENVVKKRGK